MGRRAPRRVAVLLPWLAVVLLLLGLGLGRTAAPTEIGAAFTAADAGSPTAVLAITAGSRLTAADPAGRSAAVAAQVTAAPLLSAEPAAPALTDPATTPQRHLLIAVGERAPPDLS